VKGRLQDLWDQGTDFGGTVTLNWIVIIVVTVIGWLAFATFLAGGRWVLALLSLAAMAVINTSILAIDAALEPSWPSFPLIMRADWFIITVLVALGVLAFAILAFTQRWVAAVVCLGLSLAVAVVIVGVTFVFAPPWAVLPLNMSFVLGVVVGLLSLEWLTRKLLKLA
jgi:hypothetical protein